MSTGSTPTTVPSKRIAFYLLYDPRGRVDDYIPYKLERLKPHVDELIVVVNGALSEEGKARLAPIADDVWERENVGFDVGAYQWALRRLGPERLAEFDELLLLNYTWFGPVGDFAPLFERMDAADVDYWGVTDHGPVETNPLTGELAMRSHIQSHWIAVRRSLFTSPAWREYWQTMPVITSYSESIALHEARFTSHFEDLGFRYTVAYPFQDYPGTIHPAFERAQTLLEQGCPVLKRRTFFHDPLYLDRHGLIGRWLIDTAARLGYPTELLLQNLVRTTKPKVLNTNASMLEILPDVDVSYDPDLPMKIAATVHIFYEDMTDELLDALGTLPTAYDLYVTTTDEAKAAVIRAAIDARADTRIARSEVRIVPSNRGRDQSAFYIGTRDVVLDGGYDLIVKVHSKKTVQEGAAIGTFFKRQQIENLLGAPGYTANLLALFQREAGLGVVFPPTVHIGFPTLGGAWFTNKPRAAEMCKAMGIHVPLDDRSPLAPFGAMFVARPQALRLLFEQVYDYEDYAPVDDYGDGSLAHVQERLVSYAAAEFGFHTRTVANSEYAAISHTFLEYKLDQLSKTVQGYALDEVHVLNERESLVKLYRGGRKTATLQFLSDYYPRVLKVVLGGMNLARRVLRRQPAPSAAE